MIKPYNGSFGSSSFHGHTIYATANQLKKLFGDWHESDPNKVNYEWSLILNDEIPFTIYDWKEPGLREDSFNEYHIGARNIDESRIIKDAIDTYLNNIDK